MSKKGIHMRKRDPEQVKYSILDDDNINCTCTEAAKRLGIKNYMVRSYIVKHDAKTFDDVRAIRARLQINRLALAPCRSDQLPFDRSLVCYRSDFRERCSYYMEMLDDVIFNSHIAERCRGNGVGDRACPNYSGELVLPITNKMFDRSVVECNETKMLKFNKRIGK